MLRYAISCHRLYPNSVKSRRLNQLHNASDTLLHDDPFHNERTQHLFEAVDELRSCGADTDIGSLPEVHFAPLW